MFNQGIEVSIDGMIVKTKTSPGILTLMHLLLKREITALPQKKLLVVLKICSRSSIYDYWLRSYAGVDPADGYALFIVDPLLTTQLILIQERNGVNVTINQNKSIIRIPWICLFGSFTNTFKVGGFQLDVLFTYQIGGQTYDTNYAALMLAGCRGYSTFLDIWVR
jgi:hypothetical protein